jgi:pimeloyl-ACP methyl ester carboxylesterase
MSARRDESVRLKMADGGELAGSLSYTGEVGPALVLYAHGFGSGPTGNKADAVAAACAHRDWPYAAFAFRGHAPSSCTMRELTGSGLQEDLERAWAYLAGRGVRRLFLVGSSMGGWAGAWFALRHPKEVAALAALAPAFRFLERRWEERSEAERRAWRQTGRLRLSNQWLDVELGYALMEERERFAAEALAAGWATPLLIFHGMRDEAVPYEDSLDFVRRVSFPDVELRLLKDGDHRLLALKEEMAESACRFFARRGQQGDDVI